jgi:hypothetical protein
MYGTTLISAMGFLRTRWRAMNGTGYSLRSGWAWRLRMVENSSRKLS